MHSDIRCAYFLIILLAVAGILATLGVDEHKVRKTIIALFIFLAVYIISLGLMIGLI